MVKGTLPNRGSAQRQTKATAVPSGMAAKRPAAIKGDPRSGKGLPGVGNGGSNKGGKRAPGLYDVTKSSIGTKGTGTKTGPGKQANFKRS